MDEKQRTAHSMTQVLGLILMAGSIVVFMAILLMVTGGDEDIVSFVPIALAVTVLTFVVWRFDALWSRILGVVLTFATAALFFFLAFGVFQLFSPIEFTVGLSFLVGFLLSLVGGIRAIIAGRRSAEGPTDGEKRLRSRVLTGIVVLSVVSIVGFFFTRATVDEAAASGAVALEMTNFEFNPQSTSVPSSGKLLIHNSDLVAHDFTLDALDIAVAIGPGSDALVDLSGAAPGTYSYVCTIHEGMTGVLTISG